MDEEAIANRIFMEAEKYAHRKGYRFGEGADHQFRYISKIAAKQIADLSWKPSRQRALRAKARTNFRIMIDEMIRSRPAAYANNAPQRVGDMIGETTLGMARQKLCPIWPFC